MTVLAFDDADGARGFRLAGVDAVTCETADDVNRGVAHGAAFRTGVAVVVVSPRVYALAPSTFDALDAPAGWPIVLVLPGGEPAQEA